MVFAKFFNVVIFSWDHAREDGLVSDATTTIVRTLCPMNCHPTHCGMWRRSRTAP